MRVQDIAKVIIKTGLNKMEWSSKDNCIIGDYEIKKFNYNGIHSYINLNHGIFNNDKKSESTLKDILNIVLGLGLKAEIKKDMIIIYK